MILVHRAGWCCKEVDTLEKDLQSKNKTVFLPWTRLREKTFKMRLRLERLSSWLRIKLFQGQTVDLKFPYLKRSRFLCSQQRGPSHLGSMPQENMQRTTNLFFLWLLPNSSWLGRYQFRRYNAVKSRNRRTEGLAGVVEFHFRTRYRDEGSYEGGMT